AWQWAILALAVLGAAAALPALAQEAAAPTAAPAATTAPAAGVTGNPEAYGGWTLAPALVAIVCAVATRQVIPSLLLGILVAGGMMYRVEAGAGVGAWGLMLGTAQRSIETYIVGACTDSGHVKVIVFTLIIGGMVGVVGASGGTRALVNVIARHASNSRRGQFTAWLAGLVVFFDDYANSMIVGPTMQPICDRLGISRAKLAYIVDSTAAPVASIALIGTWVGTELQYIGDGLADVARTGTPPFLAKVDAWQAFVYSIPYRFYAILAIVMVLLIAMTRREFGAMRGAEADPAAGRDDSRLLEPVDDAGGHWTHAAIPILTLVGVTMTVLVWPGFVARHAALTAGEPFPVQKFFEHADSYNAILYGAFACAAVALLIAVGTRRLTLTAGTDALTGGMARVFPAIVVLVLAWALSAGSVDLHVGQVVSAWLIEKGFSLNWLPLGVFTCAAFVSFATGTSWGTMGILCPMVVRIAADLGANMPAAEALPLFYGSVGGVLSGAIFGDHCSPISDTTVLSAIASGCPLGTHVWTQLPYAFVTAFVAMGLGDTLCSKFEHSPWIGQAVGAIALVVILYVFGRRVPDAPGDTAR
ncbi:MAG TPA: Na+/H+ antiporter NhaC family protein, partial [Phycisphaerae bacterium]|nr:Na+/H+ antiporter NhaC family protein [Phycisphaerae bacterium]